MVEMFSRLVASVFSQRDSPLSIPIMDGALKPNNLLEEAPVLAERAALEDLALGIDGSLHAAAAGTVYRVSDRGEFEPVASHERDVTALAIGPDGTFAIALGNEVRIGEQRIDGADGRAFVAVNALNYQADGKLLISDASANRPCTEWRHDLMEKGRSGRLLRHDRHTGRTTTLVSGLGHAFGVLSNTQGRVIVSESWRHHLTDSADGRAVVAGLPGYPSRMAPALGGGFWLSVFACRTQLIEFVLGEDAYRREMMRSIEPRHWVAPAFSSGDDFLEPLQGGGVKQMGILKPWAPPRSYGLVVRIGDDFIPRYSLHSRVGGRHHGIVAVVQRGDELFVLSKGSGRILRLSVEQASLGATL